MVISNVILNEMLFLYYQALIKKNIGKYTTSFKQNLSLVIIRASNILITYESKLFFSRYDDYINNYFIRSTGQRFEKYIYTRFDQKTL